MTTVYALNIFAVWRPSGGAWVRGKLPSDPKQTPGMPYECRLTLDDVKRPNLASERYWMHFGIAPVAFIAIR